jgi:hypothetical protein
MTNHTDQHSLLSSNPLFTTVSPHTPTAVKNTHEKRDTKKFLRSPQPSNGQHHCQPPAESTADRTNRRQNQPPTNITTATNRRHHQPPANIIIYQLCQPRTGPNGNRANRRQNQPPTEPTAGQHYHRNQLCQSQTGLNADRTNHGST